MSEMLDVWPVLPVVIRPTIYSSSISRNITAFLDSEHHHRICAITLFDIPNSHLETFTAAMQKPFPELTFLNIRAEKNTVTTLPNSFLGGSAPLLRHVSLHNCPFPGMPKLLLSANHLYRLELRNIPDSGYFSPRDLVACLSEMSRLDSLGVEFRSSPRYPASRHTPPLTPSVLPSLTKLMFQGVHEYLEDLLAQIEAPLLSLLKITFFMDPHFVVPYLRQSINYAELFKKCHRAIVCTSYHAVRFAAFRETHQIPELSLEIMCGGGLVRQLSLLAQVCSSSLLLLSTLIQLDIVAPGPSILQTHWNMNATHWVELFDPFTAVKDLRLSNRVARDVCRGLEELAEERATEVLPALQNILMRGIQPLEPVPKFIERFVAARQRSGHPVAVYPWRDQENNECFLAPSQYR
ncbi:hypothetical protein F5148DRAFT_495424 [Russula earlei]|uniref:Uncharacterized protein n=1 Tax=Russula earlei TaxID=71964 RepID=A0ACC0TZE1_9AGAM|nr:hypothetical protein F5148DRAFT_495424 [Russula earlei]